MIPLVYPAVAAGVATFSRWYFTPPKDNINISTALDLPVIESVDEVEPVELSSVVSNKLVYGSVALIALILAINTTKK